MPTNTNPNTTLNLDKLIKLLGMTTSTSDPETLSFIRKSNKLLTETGWTWESLLLGKVKVIADPFSSIPNPAATRQTNGVASSPPRPAPQAQQPHKATPPPPPPPPMPSSPPPIFTSTNAKPRNYNYGTKSWSDLQAAVDAANASVAPAFGFATKKPTINDL